MSDSIRKYTAEFLGTFTLVFVGTAVATLHGFPEIWGTTGWLGISLAFGGTLMVLVYVIGPVSGCHVNPAVSLPMALSGRLDKSLLVGYIVSQALGAILASLVLFLLLRGLPIYSIVTHGLGANGNPREMSIATLFGWELVMTALFLFTIFAATRNDAPVTAAAPAIGGFLFVAHLVGAPLGDASLNPARSLGPAIFVQGDALGLLWLFIVAPFLGGLIGWIGYKIVYKD